MTTYYRKKQITLGCDRCKYSMPHLCVDKCENEKSPFYSKTLLPNQKACANARFKSERTPSVIELMRHNAKAYNKHITNRFLKRLTPLQLLHLVHELDRREFAIALTKQGICLTSEVAEYLHQ
jgi:hypothetical protein